MVSHLRNFTLAAFVCVLALTSFDSATAALGENECCLPTIGLGQPSDTDCSNACNSAPSCDGLIHFEDLAFGECQMQLNETCTEGKGIQNMARRRYRCVAPTNPNCPAGNPTGYRCVDELVGYRGQKVDGCVGDICQ